MIIDLPESFILEDFSCDFYAYVENNNLYIRNNSGHRSFRKLMFKLTYEIKGKHICFYCNEEIQNNKATLDHLFPQDLGGISITNNLLPSCEPCNCLKSDLNFEQFLVFRTLTNKKDKAKFMKNVQLEHENIRNHTGFYLPSFWVTYVDITKIKTNTNYKKFISTKHYKKIEDFYSKYSNFRSPIIVDKNYYLLDEYEIYLFAFFYKITIVPVVCLENVEIIF